MNPDTIPAGYETAGVSVAKSIVHELIDEMSFDTTTFASANGAMDAIDMADRIVEDLLKAGVIIPPTLRKN